MKKCCMCKKSKDESEFKSNAKRKNGLQSQCIACQKVYRKSHYEKNKQKYIDKAKKWDQEFRAWFKDLKSTYKCSRCPEDHPACMHFHHTDDNKEMAVSKLVTYGNKERVLKEIEKCVPLCANCHAKEHYNAS